MYQATTTKSRQLQHTFKTSWLSSEAAVRAKSEILAIWAALKQLSEDKNHAMCVVLLRLMKTKNFNMLLPFCQHWHLTWQSWAKHFQAGYFNFAQMKASVEPCINKLSDVAAKSELKANCKKFDGELRELRTTDGCVSSGMAFWKGTERLAIWWSPYTKRETGVKEPTTPSYLCLASQEECMPRSRENNWTKAGYTQCGFRCCRSTTEQISIPENFREILGACQGSIDMFCRPRMEENGKYIARFLAKSYVGVMGVRCWLVPLAGRKVTVFLLRKLYPRRRR